MPPWLPKTCKSLKKKAPTQNAIESGFADMLFDDLADIYRDLFDGIQYYQRNEQDDIGQAIWAWRWGYEHHWGEHMYTALKTVHEIRYFMEMP